MSHLVFAYGSLIATPEYGDRVTGRIFSKLMGYRREFNKRSPGRGAPRAQAYAAFDDVPKEYLTADWAYSLAVGTLPSSSDVIYGVTLEYPQRDWQAALSAMDAREGYDRNADRATLGYVRSTVTVHTDTCQLEAVTYLSNPGGRYDLPADTPLDVRAKILINGTPRQDTMLAKDTKVRGLGYLEQLRTELLKHGFIDPDLEAQAEAVLKFDGPWTSDVAPPQLRNTSAKR